METSFSSILVFAISVLMSSQGINSEPYCTPQQPENDQRRLPNLEMDAFTTQFRVSIIDKNYTMWAKESYDSVNNKVRMDLIKNGVPQTIVLDYEESLYIEYTGTIEEGYRCSIEVLTAADADDFNVFGFKTETGSRIPHVVSSQEILQFANSTNPVYMGRTYLEGLGLDHWQSCIVWDDVQATFTLDYYFTMPYFQPFGLLKDLGINQIPYRAEIKGTVGPFNRYLHHVYEYLEFKAYKELPVETFSLPDFMICSITHNNWNKTIPSLPDSLSYTLETVSHIPEQDGTTRVKIEVSSVYHAAERRIMRIDMGRTTSINDFNTGVEYVIDDNGCFETAIDKYNVASKITKDGLISLKDAGEIAYLKDEFQWSGEKMFRGRLTNAFVRIGRENDQMVEAYISKEKDVPVGLIVVNSKTGAKIYYHFYNFKSSPSLRSIDPFDIRLCRDSDAILDFDVLFNVEEWSENDILAHIDEILHVLRDKMAEIINVSPIQISYYDYNLDPDTEQLHWFGSFMGPSPQKTKGNVKDRLDMKSNDNMYSSIAKAIEDENLDIQFTTKDDGFALRLLGKRIQQEKSELSLDTFNDVYPYQFVRTKDKCIQSFNGDGMSTIAQSPRECAQLCHSNKWVDCNVFQYTKATKDCSFSWQDSTVEPIPSPGCDIYTISYTQTFQAMQGTVYISEDHSSFKTVDAVSSCAKLCLEETRFKCHSFDFCNDKYCRVNKDVFLQENLGINETGNLICSHYSRKILDEFQPLWSTALSFPGQAVVNTQTHEECAKLCASDESGCAMFSSCPSSSTIECILVPVSKLTTVNFTFNKDCTVYKTTSRTEKIISPSSSRYRASSSDSDGYSSGEMFGLAIAMILTGVAVGALSIFLLRHFQIWEGFK